MSDGKTSECDEQGEAQSTSLASRGFGSCRSLVSASHRSEWQSSSTGTALALPSASLSSSTTCRLSTGASLLPLASSREMTMAPAQTPLCTDRHWRFSKEQLAKIRQDLIEQAVERVRTLWEEERVRLASLFALCRARADLGDRAQAQQAQAGANGVPAPTDASASEPPSQPATPPAPSDIEYLSVADEQLLVAYYLQQAVGLCGAFKFPEAVSATALSYLKRFYLRNTAMDYHPKDIMSVPPLTSSSTFAREVDAPGPLNAQAHLRLPRDQDGELPHLDRHVRRQSQGRARRHPRARVPRFAVAPLRVQSPPRVPRAEWARARHAGTSPSLAFPPLAPISLARPLT